MPPTPPAHLRIGHVRYRVSWSKPELDAASIRRGRELSGFSSASQQLLLVDPTLPGDYRRETLLHEVLHQCLRVCGVDPDSDGAAGLKDVEERAVGAIAGALYGALRDNPELVAYLMDEGE